MKTVEQVDRVMARIPVEWRHRWCDPDPMGCACVGCVQTGNKRVIAEEIRGRPWVGDPEAISWDRLAEHEPAYSDNVLTREEWESWAERNPKE